ncbi:hypothetical protein, partial [Mesorhizobium sp.]
YKTARLARAVLYLVAMAGDLNPHQRPATRQGRRRGDKKAKSCPRNQIPKRGADLLWPPGRLLSSGARKGGEADTADELRLIQSRSEQRKPESERRPQPDVK